MKRTYLVAVSIMGLSVLAMGPVALLAVTSGTTILAWGAIALYIVVFCCAAVFAPFLLKLFFQLLRRAGDVERDVKMLTNTVGRAAPVLRRIDDRGRVLIHESMSEISCSGQESHGRLDIAIIVSSKSEAREAIELFNSRSERLGRLILVLSPKKMGRWGTWIDEDLGTGIHVVAGEHLLDGSASTELLFTSGLVACIKSFQDSAANVLSHVVKAENVVGALDLESARG